MQTSQVGTFNVIPDDVRLIGTVRTFREDTRVLAERRIAEIAAGVATALGASAQSHYRRHHPATVNSEREAIFAARGRRAHLRCGQRHPRCRAHHRQRGFLLHAAGRGPARTSGSGTAAGPAAAICTIRTTTSTTRSSRWAPGIWPRWWKRRCRLIQGLICRELEAQGMRIPTHARRVRSTRNPPDHRSLGRSPLRRRRHGARQDLHLRGPGRHAVDGSAHAQREPAAQLHRQRLRGAGRARQEARAATGAGDRLEADLARRCGASTCARA